MSDKVVSIHRKRRRGRPASSDEKLLKVNLRLPESLHKRIEAAANANFRTIVQEVHMRLVRDDAAHPEKSADAGR